MAQPDEARTQTPAQWAVRWHGIAIAALLFGSVPVLHVVWHLLLGRSAPIIETRSQTPLPAVSLEALRSGEWMPSAERHLREASPIAFWLRATWNEQLYRLGLLQAPTVHVGSDGWLYLRSDVAPDVVAFRAGAEVRKAAFAAVRDQIHAAGVELLVAIVPDKSRVHPEHLGSAVAWSAAKAPVHGDLLAELRTAGIPVVDLAAALAATRAADPEHPLFFRADSHWLPRGALVAAQAVAGAIDGGAVGGRLGPRVATRLGAAVSWRGPGDLVAMLGIATAEGPPFAGRRVVLPLSLLAHSFAEVRDYHTAEPVDPALAARFAGDDPAAMVWLSGTSFAHHNFHHALQLALGRPVRLFQADGADGIAPMRALLRELASARPTRPAVVVWEIVERGFVEGAWYSARF